MDTALLRRDFKWKTVLHRHSSQNDFKVDDFKKSVDKAISTLPEDLVIKEVVVKSENIRLQGEMELVTTIYWNE